MHLALQAFSVLLITVGTGLVALLLTAMRTAAGTHIIVDNGYGVMNLDFGLCWAGAAAFIACGVLTLVLTTIHRRQRCNAQVRQEVQKLIQSGKYGEARICAQNIRGLVNLLGLNEAIEGAQKGTEHESEQYRARPK
jgi:hypothetical protein